MRKVKWMLLATTCGVMLQLAGCADTLIYYVLEVAATQLVSGLLSSAGGTAA